MRQKRTNRIEVLQDQLEIARSEDKWDDILAEMHGVGPDGGIVGGGGREGLRVMKRLREGQMGKQGETSWIMEIENSIAQTKRYMVMAMIRSSQHAARFWEIVKMEREVAERERKARVMKKNAERRARKLAEASS